MKYLKKYKYVLTGVLFILIILYVLVIKKKLEVKNDVILSDNNIIDEEIKQENNVEIKDEVIKTVMVDIKGAVKNPGVYEVEEGRVINDVIKLAGGLTKDSDTSVTNLSKRVSNEMVIIIYTKKEVKNSNIPETVIKVVEKECVCPSIKNDGCLNTDNDEMIGEEKLININKASLEELMSLSGVGETKAQAIIKYREETPFTKIEDLLNVDGFGSKLYEEIKIHITT